MTTGRKSKYAVEARKLKKVFRVGKKRIVANDDISLHINEGEIYSILGPNGAGKTTFIKIVSTLIIPTSGDVLVDGRSVLKDEIYVRSCIGLSTGFERSFYYRLSGYQNLLFFGSLYGIPSRKLVSRINLLLEEFGLYHWRGVQYMKYSTGMKKKLSLIRALLHDPKVLIFDEPMSSVDPESTVKLREVITNLKQKGKTILIATHNIREAEALSDRIAIMKNGRIVAEGSPFELKHLLKKKVLRVMQVNKDKLDAVKSVLRRYGEENFTVSGKKLSCILDDTELLPDIIAALNESGIAPSEILIDDPDLEEAFVSILKEEESGLS